ncbi:hypothetical protein [Gracilibacillus alcaliphilus]|uniref:hypothetical protein n=1 Tax=Gracilibacillus alcaliphilus TaxID=1401441 RepID=UPI00195CA204|nr:hypothetical protein [Gracilibacillus alcaliphilus]MBM7675271.1 hypothetical protein [Gracilibacillus alcaliphilus]
MIALKIIDYDQLAKVISIIRRFDNRLSIKELKKNIFNQNYIMEYDIYQFDIAEEMNQINRCDVISEFVSSLIQNGAKVGLYIDNEKVTLAYFYNYLDSNKAIMKETLLQIERETGEI